ALMEVIHRCCCGLDVHKRTVVACLIQPAAGGRPTKALRTFGTMSEDLLALADWLRAAGCTQVAMESTEVFWKPAYNLLAGQVAGETNPALLAELAQGRLRTKRAGLARALSGRVSDHHRLLLTTHLAQVDFLDEEVARRSAAIAERLQPLEEELARLDT